MQFVAQDQDSRFSWAGSKPQDPFALIAFVVSAIALTVAILYLVGWVYLSTFFATFAIDTSVLELSFSDIIANSLHVASHTVATWQPDIVVVAAISAGLLAVLFPSHIAGLLGRATSGRTGHWLMLAVFLLIGSVAVVQAQRAGPAGAKSFWMSGGEEIHLNLADGCAVPRDLPQYNDANALRVLKATPKYYFLYVPTGAAAASADARKTNMDLRWFRVPVACVGVAEGKVSRQLVADSGR